MNQPNERMQQQESIRTYILNELIKNPDQSLAFDDDLLLSGFLDSVSVVRLVAHIEELCSIKIPPEDILIEHFGSIDQMGDYLAHRKLDR